MVNPLTPDNTRSWLRVILEATDKATSITLVFMFITGGLMGWFLLGELKRTREMNLHLWERLMAAQVALARDCPPDEGR